MFTDKRELIKKSKEKQYEYFKDSSIKKYIFGRNYLTLELIKFCEEYAIRIEGIIDDFTNDRGYQGYKIYKLSDLNNEDTLIISCVVDGNLLTANNVIEKNGAFDQITFLELALFEEKLIKVIRFNQDNIGDILSNIEKYRQVRNILEDEESKSTFDNILDFRGNFNSNSLNYFKMRIDEQYFEEFLCLDENEVFLDCGGFDGDTTIKFIENNPRYKKILYFEPSKNSFEISKNKLQNVKNINLYNYAIGNCNGQVTFDNSLSSASKISEEGSEVIEIRMLDSVIDEKVTFIKLDIEGAELDALQGAKSIIDKYKPKIAVCVYHNQEHFWKIPEFLLSINPKYKVYLRHYSQGLLETVMFFV